MHNDRDTQTYFTRAASLFDSLYSEEKMSPLMRIVNKHLRRDIYERFLLTMGHIERHRLATVLDVGCGSGRYAAAMGVRGVERVVGIDFSPAMIELARTHTKDIPNADRIYSFQCGDYMQFETEERFDLVLAMGVFDYVADPVAMLSKMRAQARHSVLVSFPSVSWYRTPVRKVRYALKKCPVYFYTRDRIQDIAARAGFSSVEIQKIRGAGMDYIVALSA
jgi:2-polyprenyl-3-methyl-5-hydroxy-6-metoxy-1,4-benzoquinol methylase